MKLDLKNDNFLLLFEFIVTFSKQNIKFAHFYKFPLI
jgi:hypothetical protein